MNGFQEKIVNRALNNIDLLDDWELDFIKGLDASWRDRDLGDTQNATLNDIAAKLGRAGVY